MPSFQQFTPISPSKIRLDDRGTGFPNANVVATDDDKDGEVGANSLLQSIVSPPPASTDQLLRLAFGVNIDEIQNNYCNIEISDEDLREESYYLSSASVGVEDSLERDVPEVLPVICRVSVDCHPIKRCGRQKRSNSDVSTGAGTADSDISKVLQQRHCAGNLLPLQCRMNEFGALDGNFSHKLYDATHLSDKTYI
jgi:hypothetical protein